MELAVADVAFTRSLEGLGTNGQRTSGFVVTLRRTPDELEQRSRSPYPLRGLAYIHRVYHAKTMKSHPNFGYDGHLPEQ